MIGGSVAGNRDPVLGTGPRVARAEPVRADRAGDQASCWPGPNGLGGMILPGLPQEVVAESPSPGLGEECPQTLLSRTGRLSIRCAQIP